MLMPDLGLKVDIPLFLFCELVICCLKRVRGVAEQLDRLLLTLLQLLIFLVLDFVGELHLFG